MQSRTNCASLHVQWHGSRNGPALADSTRLLKKKLGGTNSSTASVAAADKWAKQILHIWTLRPDWVPVVQAA